MWVSDILRCCGHFGYGSGWKSVDFCKSCPRCVDCRHATTTNSPPGIVEQNRVNGVSDRIEGTKRYADSTVTVRSITR